MSFLFLPSLSSAITVGPTKLQISVDPGQSATGFLFVKNDEFKTQTFYPLVQKFSQSANGEKVFTDDTAGIAKWIQLPEPIVLGSQEERQVPFTLTAPPDAAPGGHFAVIWWSTSPPTGGQVAIVTRAGILVYVRVSGDILEKGYIESFGAGSRFSWKLPVSFVSGFKNEGNVALTPQGDIRVTNMFGTLKAVVPVNPYGGIILPGSNGNFTSIWDGDEGFFFGAYKASLHFSYGESNQTADRTWWFVVLSPLAAVIVLLVIVLVFIAPPLIRKYNRWIVERAQQ